MVGDCAMVVMGSVVVEIVDGDDRIIGAWEKVV